MCAAFTFSLNMIVLFVTKVKISKQATVGAWMTKFTCYFMKMMIPK